MTRMIDADALIKECANTVIIAERLNEQDISRTFSAVLNTVLSQPTIEAIPIEWILNNERMPKAGTGRKVIMDMLEDWRKEHDTAD